MTVAAGDSHLKFVNKFCYLGSYVTSTTSQDEDITARIAKASSAFGKLRQRLWREHGISLSTKINVYRVLGTLLYGSECWNLYRKHVRRLEQFHLRCLRSIAGIRWQDRITIVAVLDKCGITGIEAFLLQA